MANMTLRLTAAEHAELRDSAEREGISLQDAARRAIRSYCALSEHRARVGALLDSIEIEDAELLYRLAET